MLKPNIILDDDQIETAIYVRFRDLSVRQSPGTISSPSPGPSPMEMDGGPFISGHDTTDDGSPACCKRSCDEGLVDCSACLKDEWGNFSGSLGPEELEVAQSVMTVVAQGKEKGVTKDHLLAEAHAPRSLLFAILQRMTDASVPLIFWAGYTSLVLVSSAYLKSWSVIISQSPMTRIFPRRWFDISGRKIADLWAAATRAVIGVLVFRPGITQAELRWRLRSVYDRQEVNDILRHLQEEGFVNVRRSPLVKQGAFAMLDDEEEKSAL